MKILLTILLLGLSVFAQDQAAVERALAACGPISVRFDVHPGLNPTSAGTARAWQSARLCDSRGENRLLSLLDYDKSRNGWELGRR